MALQVIFSGKPMGWLPRCWLKICKRAPCTTMTFVTSGVLKHSGIWAHASIEKGRKFPPCLIANCVPSERNVFFAKENSYNNDPLKARNLIGSMSWVGSDCKKEILQKKSSPVTIYSSTAATSESLWLDVNLWWDMPHLLRRKLASP